MEEADYEPGFEPDEAPEVVRPAGCSNPFRTKSGLYVRCQSRLRSKCESCAELYRGDWAAIARSGVFDGPVERYSFYLLTLTAPSFGRVHRVPKASAPAACGCGGRHTAADADLRGVPLDPSTYDYAGLVAWNRDSGLLWDRTRRRLRDRWESVEFFVVREWQERGALHLHAIVRIDRLGAPDARVLADAARTATAFSRVDGGLVEWGSQVRCDAFRADGDGAKTIWYLSKALNYVLKDTAGDADGKRARSWEHVARLADAARMMRCSPGCEPNACRSRTHERFGARGHVVSASRRTKTRTGWSFTGLTRRVQRMLRTEWVTKRAEAATSAQPEAALEHPSRRARRELMATPSNAP
ncbi:replication initiator [Salinibacterium sp. ZJ70]|uniref:replication initiator n=1 Tax=Salinibacterium sp. ZJ70 TaxID=2708084 RepID=UPI0014231466|nr:replication initiator [Salinibacterium sp. ZJ70]